MAQYLRVIRQSRWLQQSWVNAGDLQADALRDIQTEGNRLSVYRVNASGEIDRIVVALAANRGSLGNIDYAIIDDSSFPAIGITLQQQPGATHDSVVNALHYDLTRLTVSKLTQFAQLIASGPLRRTLKKDLQGKLQNAVNSGRLDRDKLQEGLRAKLY